jgi:hypothetical protein
MYDTAIKLLTYVQNKSCLIGPGQCRPSENAHKPKQFAESTFHELRTCGGPKRKLRIFEPSRAFDTPLRSLPKKPRFLCRSRPRFPRLLKAALNVFIAEGHTLDDQGT